MSSRSLILGSIALSLAVAASAAFAHEKVKLTGYLVDVMCAAGHVKDSPEDATRFAAEHTKECALMQECIKSGFGLFSDGKWYPFDDKGNEIAKGLVEKTTKKDHIKVTVEAMKHEGKLLVEKITEVE
jgi:hypothetical protein